MNDYKDKYSVYSDNTLRNKQYEIKNHVSITENDIINALNDYRNENN